MKQGNALGIASLLVLLSSCAGQPAYESGSTFDKPFSFSILEDYDKGEDLREVEADFLLFRELGLDTWRGSFGWDDYEPEPGRYDFGWLHRFAELAADYRIDLRPYVGYTPGWAAKSVGADEAVWNEPPAEVDAWQRFVDRLVSAMDRHANVLSFEIYNEQNSPMWWDGSADEYAQVLIAGSEAVRAAGGEEQVLLGGLTYPDLEWLEQVCADPAAGPSFDILPIHAYPETWPAETPLETYLAPDPDGFFHGTFVPAAEEACGSKPIWVNEAGFATTPGEKSERDQANWWARAIALFAADRRVEHVGIYEIKDRPRALDVIGEPENYHLGLTYPDRRRKLAFHTVRRLVQLLDTGTITVADIALAAEITGGQAGELHHHLFVRPDGTQVLILWDKARAPNLRITLANEGSVATEYALDGTARVYGRFDGRRLHDVQLTPGEVRIFAIE